MSPQAITTNTASAFWPVARAPVVSLVELQCQRCGYKIRWRSKEKPHDYDAMAADFLRKHTEGGCHDTTHEARG